MIGLSILAVIIDLNKNRISGEVGLEAQMEWTEERVRGKEAVIDSSFRRHKEKWFCSVLFYLIKGKHSIYYPHYTGGGYGWDSPDTCRSISLDIPK